MNIGLPNKSILDNDNRQILDEERINFITKCNILEKDLESLMKQDFVQYYPKKRYVLLEKIEFIQSIRNIVNDIGFQNKKEFKQLYDILKEISKDISKQQKSIIHIEKKSSNRDELVNMIIQRLMRDSSKDFINEDRDSQSQKILDRDSQSQKILDRDSQSQKILERDPDLMEKMILHRIRREFEKEHKKTNLQNQDMNSTLNFEVSKKLQLIQELTDKLMMMEQLYENIKPSKKQQKELIAVIKPSVKKTIYKFNENTNIFDTLYTPPKQNTHPKANTIYVVD